VEQLRLPDDLIGDLCDCQPANARQVNARAEISRLRAAGYGAAETARSLNARGVPTPTGRGKWWPETVRRHADPAVTLAWRRYMADYRSRAARR
jgi:hypothetical protein